MRFCPSPEYFDALDSTLMGSEANSAAIKPENQKRWPVKSGADQLGMFIVSNPYPIALSLDESLFVDSLLATYGANLADYLQSENEKTKIRLEADMEAAHQVQESLLAMNAAVPNVDVAYYYRAAEQTGGDWCGHFYDRDRNICFFCCCDVTGHGLPSATLTGVATGALEALFASYFDQSRKGLKYSPEAAIPSILNYVNLAIFNSGNLTQKAMTMVLAALDLETGQVWLCNAGHNYPFLASKGQLKRKGLPGPRLGVNDADLLLRVKTFNLEAGDFLILYTDGLIENTGPDDEVLEQRTIRNVIQSLENKGAREVLDAIILSGQKIWRDHPPEDDCTVALYRWQGP